MSADKIFIVEDFVSKEFQTLIQQSLENHGIPVFYGPATFYDQPEYKKYPTNNTIEYPQFTHIFIASRRVSSDLWKMVEPINFFLCAKTGAIRPQSLVKCKLNVNCKVGEYDSNMHYSIHTDVVDQEKGITGIYYVNDSDGDTLFFNDEGTEVIKRISPKQGTMVYFDNQIPHAGQPPKINNYRAVINFNWID